MEVGGAGPGHGPRIVHAQHHPVRVPVGEQVGAEREQERDHGTATPAQKKAAPPGTGRSWRQGEGRFGTGSWSGRPSGASSAQQVSASCLVAAKTRDRIARRRPAPALRRSHAPHRAGGGTPAQEEASDERQRWHDEGLGEHGACAQSAHVTSEEALELHARGRPGKIEITPTKPLTTRARPLARLFAGRGGPLPRDPQGSRRELRLHRPAATSWR